MEYEPETYIIPHNVTDNGNVINGSIKKKNAYEAAAVAGVGVVLSFGLLWFLPLLARIAITTIFVLLAIIALFGIKGESFIEYVLEVFFFKRKQRVMKYRLPRKDVEPKKGKFKF